MCCVLVGHPFDLIKVRMQTGTTGVGSAVGVLPILRQTMAREGLRGIYRGVSAPITAVSPLYAICFWGYDMGKRVVVQSKVAWASVQSKPPPLHPEQLTLGEISIAGGLSALPATVLMTPTERIKCLLQIQQQGGTAKYSGMLDCAQQVYREGGIRSLYRGTFATLLRDVPGSVIWFGTYEFIKKELMILQGIDQTKGALSPLAVLTAGGLAGMACWAVTIPPDVLKSRFQTAPEGTYKGLWDVYTKLMREEGASALFTGMRPAMIRAFPANAACFFGMEVARKFLAFMD